MPQQMLQHSETNEADQERGHINLERLEQTNQLEVRSGLYQQLQHYLKTLLHRFSQPLNPDNPDLPLNLVLNYFDDENRRPSLFKGSKEHFRCSPLEFQRSIRMDRISELLLDPKRCRVMGLKGVGAIAAEMGFKAGAIFPAIPGDIRRANSGHIEQSPRSLRIKSGRK